MSDPDNDDPLLRYAAWLEARGNPQGEFIRVDRQLEQMAGDDPLRPALDARWTELYESHGKQFVAPLQKVGAIPVLAGKIFPGLSLKRGVLGRVHVESPGIVPEKLARLFALAPLVDELVLNFDDMPIREIMERPEMSRVRVLDLEGPWRDDPAETMQALAQSPHAANLVELKLMLHEIGPEGAHWLSQAAFLTRLRRLELPGSQIGPEGLEELLARDAFGQLRALDLSNSDLDGDALTRLAQCASLRHLQELKLEENANASDGLPSLADATFASSLTSLAIGAMHATVTELAEFARGRYERLESFDLSNSGVDDVTLEQLTKAGWLAGLKCLNLAGNELGEESGRRLAQVPFRRLEQLKLNRNQLGDAGLEALAAAPCFRTVRELDLTGNEISDRGLQALVASSGFSELKSLDLSDNEFGEAGAAALASSRCEFESLTIDDSAAGPRGKQLLEKRYGDRVTFY